MNIQSTTKLVPKDVKMEYPMSTQNSQTGQSGESATIEEDLTGIEETVNTEAGTEEAEAKTGSIKDHLLGNTVDVTTSENAKSK